MKRRSFFRIIGAAALAAVAPQAIVQAAPIVLPEFDAVVATNPLFAGELGVIGRTTIFVNDPLGVELWARSLEREALRASVFGKFTGTGRVINFKGEGL